MSESKIITDELIFKTLDEFKTRYSEIGKNIRYKQDGYDLSLVEFIDEIKNDTALGKKFKEKLIFMALLNLLEIGE